MRKFIAVLLCAFTAFAAVSCSVCGSQKTRYTVTFVQNGKVVFTLEVVDGSYPEILPEIQPKTGYDLRWSKIDFGDISSDVTVTVMETPKTYTVTLIPDGGAFADDNSTENKTVSVTYDATYSLPECKKDGYKFVSWKIDENKSCPSAGKWTTDDNLTLTAAYELIETEKFKVRFVQQGEEDKVIEVKKGEKLNKVPAPKKIKGYNVSWDIADLQDRVITEHLTVNAVLTPKTYKVTFKYNGEETTKTATYGKKFTLLEVDGVDSWYIEGKMSNYSGEITEWSFDTDITFTANAKYSEKVRVTVNVPKGKDIPKITTEFVVEKGTDISTLLEFPMDNGSTYLISAYVANVNGKKYEIKKDNKVSLKIYADTVLELDLYRQYTDNY